MTAKIASAFNSAPTVVNNQFAGQPGQFNRFSLTAPFGPGSKLPVKPNPLASVRPTAAATATPQGIMQAAQKAARDHFIMMNPAHSGDLDAVFMAAITTTKSAEVSGAPVAGQGKGATLGKGHSGTGASSTSRGRTSQHSTAGSAAGSSGAVLGGGGGGDGGTKPGGMMSPSVGLTGGLTGGLKPGGMGGPMVPGVGQKPGAMAGSMTAGVGLKPGLGVKPGLGMGLKVAGDTARKPWSGLAALLFPGAKAHAVKVAGVAGMPPTPGVTANVPPPPGPAGAPPMGAAPPGAAPPMGAPPMGAAPPGAPPGAPPPIDPATGQPMPGGPAPQTAPMQDPMAPPLPVNPRPNPPSPKTSAQAVQEAVLLHGLEAKQSPSIPTGVPGAATEDVNDQAMGLGAKMAFDVLGRLWSYKSGFEKSALTADEGGEDAPAIPGSPMRGWQWKVLQKQQDEASSGWLPRVFKTDATPLVELLASPTRQGILGGLAGGAAGAGAGYMANQHLNTGQEDWKGALLGGGVGALLGGVGAYAHRRGENDRVMDALRRTPPGATVEDYKGVQEADTVRRAANGKEKTATELTRDAYAELNPKLRDATRALPLGERLGAYGLGTAANALTAASPGAAIGGGMGLLTGFGRGNTPEGLGRGVIRGGMAGGGVGAGATLGGLLAHHTTDNPLAAAGLILDGGALGGLGGYHLGGKLIGKPAGVRRDDDGKMHKRAATVATDDMDDDERESFGLPALLRKRAAQADTTMRSPTRSAVGESKGLSFQSKPDHYAQGKDAWDSVSGYFRGGSKKKPNPFLGKHAMDKVAGVSIGKALQAGKAAFGFGERIAPKAVSPAAQAGAGLRAANPGMSAAHALEQGAANPSAQMAARFASPRYNPVQQQYAGSVLGRAAGAVGGAAQSVGNAGRALAPMAGSVGQTALGGLGGYFAGDDLGVGNETGAVTGMLAANPYLRRFARGRGAGRGVMDTAMSGVRRAGVGSLAGSGIDESLGAFGVNQRPVIDPSTGRPMLDEMGNPMMESGHTFGRMGAFGGLGSAALGRGAQRMARGAMGTEAGKAAGRLGTADARLGRGMNDFAQGTFDPMIGGLKAMVRKPLQWAGAKNVPKMFQRSQAPLSGAQIGGRLVAGAGLGAAGLTAGNQMLKDKMTGMAENSLQQLYPKYAPDVASDMKAHMDDWLAQKGLLNAEGGFDMEGLTQRAGNQFGLPQMVGNSADKVLAGMGMNPAQMNARQKWMILGGMGSAGLGAVTGNPMLAGMGGLGLFGGMMPGSMPGQTGGGGMPGPNQGQAHTQPRNEWEVQQQLNGM